MATMAMPTTVQSQTMMDSIVPQETLHMRLTTKTGPVGYVPQPPVQPKSKNKLRLDPQRALEPARKKLSTVEAQRIMAVLMDSIKKIELVTGLPYIMENIERFRVVLGTDLVQMLEDHKIIIQSFVESKSVAERILEKDKKSSPPPQEDGEDGSQVVSRRTSNASLSSQADSAMRNLALIAKQMQFSCKNILRGFGLNPAALTSVLRDFERERKEPSKKMISEMGELRDILMGMLLTTPVEETERNQYLREISERERYNAGIIQKLEAELKAAQDDKENEIRKKNDVIRRLQADLHQIEKFSDEHIRRTKSEAEKQEAADLKNSEGKRGKLSQEINQLRTQLQNLVSEHRENEQALRKKKFKIETEVENWIQKYDQDMGERQAEFEEIDAVYTEEKKQLNELEERFKTLEAEYTQIMEERRIARERREAAERELQMCIRAATTIQAFWRSFKVRKALKSKKKKKGGKKKK